MTTSGRAAGASFWVAVCVLADHRPTSITSTFAETSPHVGIYEDAHDIFVNSNSLVGPGTTEMIGAVNILAFFNYAIEKSWIPASAPLNQICFGVEICETNGGSATFQFTDFSITTN